MLSVSYAEEHTASVRAIERRLVDARGFFADEGLDETLDVNRRWWRTMGRGTWAPRARATIKRHPGGRLMRARRRLERAATDRGKQRGRRTRAGASSLRLTLSGLSGKGRYPVFLAQQGRQSIADPTQSDAKMLAVSYTTWLLRGA